MSRLSLAVLLGSLSPFAVVACASSSSHTYPEQGESGAVGGDGSQGTGGGDGAGPTEDSAAGAGSSGAGSSGGSGSSGSGSSSSGGSASGSSSGSGSGSGSSGGSGSSSSSSSSGSSSGSGSGSSSGDAGTDAGGAEGGTCPSPIPSDPYAAQRASCTFTAGALATSTLPVTTAQQAQIASEITHVIVMMKENRGFDHLLGALHNTRPEVAAIPSGFTNPNATDGGPVAPFHATTTCISHDPDHQWDAMHEQVNDGGMNGFILSAASSTSTNGLFALSYYEPSDLPFYYWLANTYPINDMHFPSVRSGTYPNRNFLLLGWETVTSSGDIIWSTGDGYPPASDTTIMDELTTAGVTWGAYSDDGGFFSGTLDWQTGHPNTGTFETFMSLLEAGTLPQVAFVDGLEDVTDDHPTADVQAGEAWSREIYTAATASSLWPHLAMLWTYDEAGGFFDHVPPPNNACIAIPGNADSTPFYELGVRVPMIVISPYARANYVSHVVQDHTAVTRFIETVFNLPALTSRDANMDALLDMFDFDCPPSFLTPSPPPDAGTGGCEGTPVLTVSSPNVTLGSTFTISFSDGPGNDAEDWIGIYPYTSSGPTQPGSQASLMWLYIGGTQTASTEPTSGTLTFSSNNAAKGSQAWPLPVGSYIAYYLLDNGYTAIASIDFNVVAAPDGG